MSRKSYPRRVRFNRFTPKVGAQVMVKPYINTDSMGRMIRGPITGTIVYINYRHRFYVAEFSCPGGKIREAFKFCVHSDFACFLPKEHKFVETSGTPGATRRVRDLSTGKIYASIAEASRQTGLNNDIIGRSCRNERKKLDGIAWEYV